MHRSLTKMIAVLAIAILSAAFTGVAKADKGGSPPNKQDTTSPQPLSNADQNSGGANGQCPGGPYCSTRDGSPSLNGNGNGNANGKPCAGCVGKADNKNPKGQMPNGSDSNNGYECDGNNGIGKSNPAHTGCHESSQPPTPCPQPAPQPNLQPSPSPTPSPAPGSTTTPQSPPTTRSTSTATKTKKVVHKTKKHKVKHHKKHHHKPKKHHKKVKHHSRPPKVIHYTP